VSEVRVTAHFRIRPGKTDEFVKFAMLLTEKVRVREAGQTLAYAFYFSADDPTACIAHEVFESADAFDRHLDNLTDEVGAAADLFEIERSEICGPIPDEVARKIWRESPVGHGVHRYYGHLVTAS
jgi:quinol monooxygenase YgiN